MLQEIHIIASLQFALASQGLKYLLEQLGHKTICVVSPKAIKKQHIVSHLFLMDECLSFAKLEEFYQWKKLILLYSPTFPLSQAHLLNLPIVAHAIWHIEDLQPKNLKDMLHLLSLNNKVHSSRISQRLQRPLLFLEDFDFIVLKALADGLHTDEICLELNTSKSTIERHKRKLKEQLGDEFTTDCVLSNTI
jgi:hypothetical protein